MDRSEFLVIRLVLACLVFAGCAVVASAAPAATDHDRSATNPSTPALAVQQVRVLLPDLRDEAAMVLIGTALIGLAAAVRRSA
jgi:hypothetical protein